MIEVVKGGLILDLGVRGFLPASLVDIRRVHDLDEFMGTDARAARSSSSTAAATTSCSRAAPCSRRSARRCARQILDRLQPGRRRRGQDLEHRRLRRLRRPRGHRRPDPHLRALLEPRQPPVRGARDRRRRSRSRCSTSIATASASRSVSSRPRRIRGSSVVEHLPGRRRASRVRVTKVVTFGAFVEILAGVEGLVHISELADHHVENPREVVSQGDDVNVQDPRDRRRAPSPVAQPQAGRGGRPDCAQPSRRRRWR